MSDTTIIELTADIVAAHVSNNPMAASDVPALIRSVFDALSGTGERVAVQLPKAEPAVSIRASIKPDYLICLEDGKKLKMLKRHLRTNYGMSPDEYRHKWGLAADYPMVAPNYAETRRALAHKIGLGRRPRSARGTGTQPEAAAQKGGRRRLGIAAAKEAAQQHLGAAQTETVES